jgi:hypothetical protein
MEPVRYFEAGQDDAAIELAEGWRGDRGAELWRSYRVIRQWNASIRSDQFQTLREENNG